MSKAIDHKYKKRHSWQIGFLATDEKTKWEFTCKGPATTFYALRLCVFPCNSEILVLEQNGEPVSDGFSGVLNRAWFARWKTPPGHSAYPELDAYELQENGVKLKIERGDVITLHLEEGCQNALLFGFCEEE